MNDRNLDLLIDAAANSRSDIDYQAFFKAAQKKEIFFNLSNLEKPNTNEIKIPTVSVGNNLNAVVFFTSSNDKRLGKKYAGIVWEKGLEMASKIPETNGIVIQSASDAWIAITKEKIEEILSQQK